MGVLQKEASTMDHLVTYVENYFTTFFQNSFGNRQEASRDFVKTPRHPQHHQQETDFDWESRPINVTGSVLGKQRKGFLKSGFFDDTATDSEYSSTEDNASSNKSRTSRKRRKSIKKKQEDVLIFKMEMSQ